MGWLLNGVYLMLAVCISPVILWKRFRTGKYRDGWGQKLLGKLPERETNGPCVWFHAVSVGEVLQLRTVLRELLNQRPDLEIVVSTTTSTGHAVAKEQFPDHTVCYFPLDFTWAVKHAFRRIRPTAIVLVELELWPNFIRIASKMNIPLALINGRISERSFRGYSRIRPLMRNLLRRFDLLAAQDPTYAERLIELGAPREVVHVTGSVKFDGINTQRDNSATQSIQESLGLKTDETVLLAGSTQSPEEEVAIRIWLALRDEFPKLRLVLVPRHQERFEEVAELVGRFNLPLVRRSVVRDSSHSAPPQADATPVVLVDTLGELAACWGFADMAFVGGSLSVGRGGQNMIEPAAYGVAVVVGPDTKNFRSVVEMLQTGNAIRVAADAEELQTTFLDWLRNPEDAREIGQRAQALVLTQQGATSRTCELLLPLLDGTAKP
ncbi:3-deoxy-D-manno-octulosonic acid transferase [Thalassoroseus pseudoceratinae]|uniref:3-deoxy-D-manno-octulosonic acid transferase n=1 Tax=Thalassoroseus pseudoceratinae TaxID=2713176 RepID=UPI00142470EA|nr:3-deoxy-D-manno-octulosonic acid transferase [Thalassoroseus pseudoceratinae]